MKKLSSEVQDVDRCVNEKQNSDSGEMRQTAPCLSETAIPKDNSVSAAGSFTSEDGILIHRATFLVCDPCVKLEGQECHTPECVFCFQPVAVARAVLNKTLNCPIIDGERIVLLGGNPITQDGASASALSTTTPDHSPASKSSSESTSVHQPDVQAAELLREGARDYATHAARLQSDGCESALSFAHDYNTKASVLREYADKIDALAASPVQVDEVSNLHLCVVCHVNGVSPEEGFDTCTDCAKRI